MYAIPHTFYHFNTGDKQTKREILTALGQNYTLKDQKLVISLNEWLKPIILQYPAIEKEYYRLEPKKGVAISRQKEVFASLSPLMRGLVDDVRTAIKNYNGYVYIPNLREFMEISLKNAAAPAGTEPIPMSSAKIIYGDDSSKFQRLTDGI